MMSEGGLRSCPPSPLTAGQQQPLLVAQSGGVAQPRGTPEKAAHMCRGGTFGARCGSEADVDVPPQGTPAIEVTGMPRDTPLEVFLLPAHCPLPFPPFPPTLKKQNYPSPPGGVRQAQNRSKKSPAPSIPDIPNGD